MYAQDFLTMWYIENPVVVKLKDVSVEEELKVMYVEECKLHRVFLAHYDPEGSDSPIQSLGQLYKSTKRCGKRASRSLTL